MNRETLNEYSKLYDLFEENTEYTIKDVGNKYMSETSCMIEGNTNDNKTYQVMYMSGYTNIKVYDEEYSEYGNDDEKIIFDEEYETPNLIRLN